MKNRLLTTICLIFLAGCSKPELPSGVTDYNVSGNTLEVTLYVQYGTNSSMCANKVMMAAHFLATESFPDVSKINIEYGIDYTDKYGKDKKDLIGNFSPNLNDLKKYKWSSDYASGESGETASIYRKFRSKGFK